MKSPQFVRSVVIALALGLVVAVPSSARATWYGTWADFVPLYERISGFLAPFGYDLPPFSEIRSPIAGETIEEAGIFTVTADAIDDQGILRVEVWLEDTLVGIDYSAPYSLDWSVSAEDNGPQMLRTKVVDSAGQFTEFFAGVFIDIPEAPPPVAEPAGLVAFLPSVGFANDLVIRGALAFAASDPFGLAVFDVTDPTHPVFEGSAAEPFLGSAVDARGTRAVVLGDLEGDAYLWVLDTQDSAQPEVVGELDLGVAANLGQDLVLTLDGRAALLAMGSVGVTRVDISASGTPTVAGTYDTPGFAYEVVLGSADQLAYVADGIGDLQILDISAGGTPQHVGGRMVSGIIRDVALNGSFAWLVDQQGGLAVVDVSDPASTQLKALRGLGGFGLEIEIENGVGIAITASASGDTLKTLDVSDPTEPGIGDGTLIGPPGSGRALALRSGAALVAAGDLGVVAYALSTDPILAGSSFDDFVAHTAAAGGGLVLAVGEEPDGSDACLRVLDRPEGGVHLAIVSELLLGVQGSSVEDVAMPSSADYALVAMGNNGLWRVDLSNPTSPRVDWKLPSEGYSFGVDLDEASGRAYLADGAGGLVIVNVSASIGVIKRQAVSGISRDVAAVGDEVYVLDQQGRLRAYDVNDPQSPVLVLSQALGGFGIKLTAEGDKLVAMVSTATDDLLKPWDLSGSSAVAGTAMSVGPPGTSRGVDLVAGKAYLATGSDGVQVFSVQANELEQTESFAIVGEGRAMASEGSSLVVADFPASVSVVSTGN